MSCPVKRDLVQLLVTPGSTAGPAGKLTSRRVAGAPALSARVLATSLAGTHYMTWLSFSDALTRVGGQVRSARLMYGQ